MSASQIIPWESGAFSEIRAMDVADFGTEKLALVIPTFCEAGNIGTLLTRVRMVLEPLDVPYEILVVDDDSPDATGAIVSKVASEDTRIRLLTRRGERGLSRAILYSWQRTNATVLGVMDADWQHPPELLRELFFHIRHGRDLAIGSRYVAGGDLGRWSPIRRTLSMAAVWLTWPLQVTRCRAKDPLSGFFMVRRRCLPREGAQQSGFKLLLEILARGDIRSMQEVPIRFGSRHSGTSKANLKVAWDYAWLLCRLYSGRLGVLGRA